MLLIKVTVYIRLMPLDILSLCQFLGLPEKATISVAIQEIFSIDEACQFSFFFNYFAHTNDLKPMITDLFYSCRIENKFVLEKNATN